MKELKYLQNRVNLKVKGLETIKNSCQVSKIQVKNNACEDSKGEGRSYMSIRYDRLV